jgi:uncharacterized membrane protein
MGLADLHTIVDHFTIALINLGIIFELTSAMFKNEGMKRFSWHALRLGLAFAVVSILTGFITESNVSIPPQVAQINSYHKILSYVAVSVLGFAVMLRTIKHQQFDDATRGAGLRGAYLALVVVVFFLTGITGFLGTRMVYTYGVNVQPVERMLLLRMRRV